MKLVARVLTTGHRLWLIAASLLLGALGAVAVARVSDPGTPDFSSVSETAQSLMSVLVPALGIVVVRPLRTAAEIRPTVVAGTIVAAGIGAYGAAISALALATTSTPLHPDPWFGAGTIALGGVLVQVLAFLVGTGFGMLIRQPAVAFAATIVIPLGAWIGLRVVHLEEWFTPYAAMLHLQSGLMGGREWVQWLVVFLLWGPALNAFGSARLRLKEAVG